MNGRAKLDYDTRICYATKFSSVKIIEHRGLNNLVEIVTGHLLWLSFVPRRLINQRSFDAYVKHSSGLTSIPDPNLIRQVGVKVAIL